MSPNKKFDVIIRNARIIDGTGKPSRQGGIAVAGDRIAQLGNIPPEAAALREVDARGQAIAPGFIDTHTHDDGVIYRTDMRPKVSQGVTTVITGNCGISLAPIPNLPPVIAPLDLIADGSGDLFASFKDYLDRVRDSGPTINTAAMVGHTTLRLATMDRLDRTATRSECAAMRALLDKALSEGAIGLSTGLYYQPANAASTAEVIAVSEPLSRYSALYTTHLRDEADLILDAMDEAFEIADRSDVPLILSHHKLTDEHNHGRSAETLPVILEQSKKQPLSLDVYPYNASSTVLEVKRASQVDRIMVTWSKSMPQMAGKMLHDIAADLGCSREAAVEKLLPAGAVYFTMDEKDVQAILRFPMTMVGSDGLPHDVRPHPRLWGTFPRVLGHYARDVGLFGLEEAVARMTSMPAARFGLKARGVLKAGNYADIVLFDPDEILYTADFNTSMETAKGIGMVIVNGQISYEQGQVLAKGAGRVIRNSDLAPNLF